MSNEFNHDVPTVTGATFRTIGALTLFIICPLTWYVFPDVLMMVIVAMIWMSIIEVPAQYVNLVRRNECEKEGVGMYYDYKSTPPFITPTVFDAILMLIVMEICIFFFGVMGLSDNIISYNAWVYLLIFNPLCWIGLAMYLYGRTNRWEEANAYIPKSKKGKQPHHDSTLSDAENKRNNWVRTRSLTIVNSKFKNV